MLYSLNLKLEHFTFMNSFVIIVSIAVGAASICYIEKLMLLKCQINTNTNKNGFLLSTKCLEGVLEYSY